MGSIDHNKFMKWTMLWDREEVGDIKDQSLNKVLSKSKCVVNDNPLLFFFNVKLIIPKINPLNHL